MLIVIWNFQQKEQSATISVIQNLEDCQEVVGMGNVFVIRQKFLDKQEEMMEKKLPHSETWQDSISFKIKVILWA